MATSCASRESNGNIVVGFFLRDGQFAFGPVHRDPRFVIFCGGELLSLLYEIAFANGKVR